jgi:hypothetical protein
MQDEIERLTETLNHERALLRRVQELSIAVGPAEAPDGPPSPLVLAVLWISELLGADPADVWLAVGGEPAAVPADPRALTGEDG